MIPLFNVTDESLDVAKTAKYRLSVRSAEDSFSYCILDSSRNKYIAIRVYNFGKLDGFLSAGERWKEIVENEKLLQLSFQSINIALVNQASTLVPSAIYDENRKNTFLHFNQTELQDEIVFSDTIRLAESRNVFSFPKLMAESLFKLFPGASVHHYSTSLISSLLGQFKNSPDKNLIVHIQPFSFEAILVEGGNLLFYNSFRYHAPEDFMYFLMFCCDRLKLNPEKIAISLVGEIEKNSTLYALLFKYFRNVKFGERPDSFQYSYGFSEFPAHFFYNLFSQPLCES